MATRSHGLAFAALSIALAVLGGPVRAQCSNPLVPFGPPCGVGGLSVNAAVAWDPDGPGPQPERLVVGGSFATAGNVLANNIAVWDPGTGAWSALGSGCNSAVLSLAVLPNGDLVAGGLFGAAGGVAANRIARWDGVAWSPMGSGSSSHGVSVLAVMPNGDVIAGGAFPSMGGVAVGGVARWNGSSWSAIGTSPFGQVTGLAVMQSGELVASGQVPFTALPLLARWNGATWTAFGVVNGAAAGVRTLAVAANGDLIAGGWFPSIDGVPANNIARWNGATWAPLGSGAAGVGALCVAPNGDVFVSGGTAGSGLPVAGIARWNGSVWTTLPGMRGYTQGHEPYSFVMNQARVHTLTGLANGALIAGGFFSVAGNAAAQHVASWDGAQWSALSTGPGLDAIAALETLPNGDLIAVGSFEAAGTLVTTGVARWNGAAWSNLGSGGLGSGFAAAVARLPNGDVVIGGSFASVGGVTAGSVARWNGAQWAAMGSLPANSTLRAFAVAPDGTLYAGGWAGTGVVRWNGSSWTPVGAWNVDVYALTVLPNGNLVAGGLLGAVAVWNGTAWTTLGTGLNGDVYALAVLPNGEVVAGTHEWPRVSRWNGAQWVPLGTSGAPGSTLALRVLPDGDLLAGGLFSWGGGQLSTLARWNGTAWSAVGSGAYNRASAFAAAAGGDVWVGGSIRLANGAVSSGLVRLTTTCAATAQPGGAGCSGNVVVSTLPWTGSTWRADASGLPSAALVAVVNGFASVSLPLASIFATAIPGCTLHVQPDVVDLTFAANGAASFQLVLPNSPSLAGVIFHHQMVSLALDSTLAVTATNSLQLTVGAF